ncbi:uncharacterized protein A1O5_09521 [Cladophialophora psammophila CBS 110553]|uniref:Uncharacterized protein n=1 Tax=Cladophialophora psammophila CBS 110553 TaxID=1182543 RepID=W9WHX5_9EURO|nr:uncharacterized protein A1O5_09521 [Cladophialophora psammophila CBS 110553]EXJ67508.1 hypothetical protein A1O5_09521 [Cladophialophora psammophila CBS 110553]
MIFCDRIRHDLMENNSKSFTIVGGDLNGLKEVLAWIKQCIAEQSIVKFKDLDDDKSDLFTSYANVVISAYYLGIPPRDLSDHILKRMFAIARKQLMSWEEVEWFYTTHSLATLPAEKEKAIREVAATSVFWAWWNGKLDENETPEEMMTLSVLRQENSKLDQDLHDWCWRNEAEVRQKWEEKDQLKKSARHANGHRSESGYVVDGASEGGYGARWDEPANATSTTGTNGWDNFSSEEPLGPPNSTVTVDSSVDMGSDGRNISALPPLDEMDGINGAADWAEEVSEVTRFNSSQW